MNSISLSELWHGGDKSVSFNKAHVLIPASVLPLPVSFCQPSCGIIRGWLFATQRLASVIDRMSSMWQTAESVQGTAGTNRELPSGGSTLVQGRRRETQTCFITLEDTGKPRRKRVGKLCIDLQINKNPMKRFHSTHARLLRVLGVNQYFLYSAAPE